jgi:hypothetical protein
MGITKTAIVSEYGVYINSGQNKNNLAKKLYQPSVTAAFFRKFETQDDVLRFGWAERDRVLQPFQKAFTATGNITFKPSPIPLFGMKIDDSFYPDDVEGSWLAFLADLDEPARAKWPFIRWYLEEHLAPKVEEDFELNEVYDGEFAAPTPGTAGAAGTSMDGLKLIINTHIDNSLITPITTGALSATPATFVTQVEDFVKDIPHLYRRKLDHIFMNEDKAALYREGMRVKYNANYEQASLDKLVDYPNLSIKGLPSMGASGKIWTTTAMNRINGIKSTGRIRNLKVEEAKREVAVMGDWKQGLGFMFPGLVFTNDQDLTV